MTKWGYCPRCERVKELVPTTTGDLKCHKCGSFPASTPKFHRNRARKAARTEGVIADE